MNIQRSEYTRLPVVLNDLLFKDYIEDWQMTQMERLAVIGLLEKIRPEVSIEVGTLFGGSLSAIAKYSKHVFSLDINPDYVEKLKWDPRFANVNFVIGDSMTTLPTLVKRLQNDPPVEFALIDASHTETGVRRDIEALIRYVPQKPLWIVIHDSFMPECRRGMSEAQWASSPYVHFVHLDFIPGMFNSEVGTHYKRMTCGLALALMLPQKRSGDVMWINEGNLPFDLLHGHSVHHRTNGTAVRDFAGRVKRKVRKLVGA